MARRKGVLAAVIVALVIGAASASVAGPTMAGSNKGTDGNITCGNNGKIGDVTTIGVFANTSTTQSEVEACNAQGAPNSQGRVVLRVNHNTSNPGARFSLDSDRDQTPSNICCSYINAQVGAQGTGVWCGEDAPANGSGIPGDGYSRPWNDPGDDGGTGAKNEPGDLPGPAECVPTQ